MRLVAGANGMLFSETLAGANGMLFSETLAAENAIVFAKPVNLGLEGIG
jgi:hypothetical protein